MSPTGSSTSTPPASDPTSPGAGTDPTDPLANESTFLTLLVSQLQNQDPLDPVDSNQFVSQLTAYSQLEQLIGIHQNTTSLSNSVTDTPPTSNSANSTTGA
jgi:flagellar basal-body rod modification protein FlgD